MTEVEVQKIVFNASVGQVLEQLSGRRTPVFSKDMENLNTNQAMDSEGNKLVVFGVQPTHTVVAEMDPLTTATVGNGSVGLVPSKTCAQVPAVVMSVEKPEKFSGLNFKIWQQKMLFYLTTIGFARFLTEDAYAPKEDETDPQVFMAFNAWKYSDYLCRNYILNNLNDMLYSVYCIKRTAKELWESLEKIYGTKDARSKKYIVSRFLDFMMVDSKTVVSQVQELEFIIHEIHAEGMHICESFRVASVIEKLPSGWRDFKNYLQHKRKEMSFEDLVARIRIEEDNRIFNRRFPLKTKEVEHDESSKRKKSANKLRTKGGMFKKKHPFKIQGNFFEG